MAKSNPSQDRRARSAALVVEQAKKERRRTLIFVAITVVVVLGIITVAAIPLLKKNRQEAAVAGVSLKDLGVPLSAAKCGKQSAETDGAGQGDHREQGSKIDYGPQPPTNGPHYDVWAPFAKKFYSAADRPLMGNLVHNLEHGYSIIWYDNTVAADDKQLGVLKSIASKYKGESNENMVIIAPWGSDDGAAFPDGAHIAMTHWRNDDGKAAGVRQYCEGVSGAAIEDFTKRNPWSSAPEPGIQ